MTAISAKTGLPRYVSRIMAAGRPYLYFRHEKVRIRLPDIASRTFAGTYASLLIAHGLAEVSLTPARYARSIKRREIYFIADEWRGAVKIGIAKWPQQRLQILQVGSSSPLTLLATIAGEEDVERAWHARFAHLRLRGEWFRDGPELRAAIAEAA